MQTDPSGGVPWPAAMTDLDRSERFVIWSFRCWVSADENQPLVRRGFREHLAPGRAEAALLAFESFVDAIRGAARRTIYYHAPGCPCVGVDEMHVATLVAASQERDAGIASSAARCLVHPDSHARERTSRRGKTRRTKILMKIKARARRKVDGSRRVTSRTRK